MAPLKNQPATGSTASHRYEWKPGKGILTLFSGSIIQLDRVASGHIIGYVCLSAEKDAKNKIR
jgi:hypothetical protein